MLSVEVIKKDLKESLSEYRYNHCLNVADVCFKLARVYGVDENKAYIAGLLHDVAKEFNEEENKIYVERYGLSKKLLKKENNKVLHGYVGAYYIKEKYGVSDDICRAIMVHTIADVNMSILDKIVFVADKIEPNKDYFGIEEERRLAFVNIDQALAMCLYMNMLNRLSKGKKVNKNTLKIIKKYRKVQYKN